MIKQEELTKRLQETLNHLCETDVVLKENIQLSDLLKLKNATYIINNFITYKLTLAFLNRLYGWSFINDSQYKKMCTIVEQTSTNANGFDVLYHDDISIVAEVKGNVPCKGSNFGANQRKKIIENLYSLKNGKTKAKIKTDGYYKFMVLLDDSKNVKNALDNLIKSKHMQDLTGNVHLVDNVSSISPDKINIVLISI